MLVGYRECPCDIKHYIPMTPEELAKYGKRLYSLYERDFEVKFEAG